MTSQPKLEETQRLWDEAAASFDNEPDHGLRDLHIRQAWSDLLVESLPSPPTHILDIGCGTGSLSVLLAELNYQVTGIDLSPKMIAYAKAKAQTAGYAIPFHVMNAAEPDFAPQQFDIILCRHLLWALPEPNLVLQRWAKLLTAVGQLVLVEGYWHTGGGLHAKQIVEMLPSEFASVKVKNLSDQAALWGGEVKDERYVVIATQQTHHS
ncbi:MAG: methyltransferase domain-containing protein [Anaerolineales bacterium]|nr:methyltransferase domain-containing protein [Anaerolineales bacterium]